MLQVFFVNVLTLQDIPVIWMSSVLCVSTNSVHTVPHLASLSELDGCGLPCLLLMNVMLLKAMFA